MRIHFRSQLTVSVFALLLSGCLFSHRSDTTHTGTRVSAETFAQIKPNSTTADWVESALGAPTLKVTNPDSQLWKYIYTEHTDSSGAIFLIFGGSDTTERSEMYFIEFKNGIVTNKWRG